MEMDSRFLPLVEKYVDHILEQNRDYIAEELAEGLNWGDGWQVCSAKMSTKAVKIATQLSVAAVLSLLVESGNVTLNTADLTPDLKLVYSDPEGRSESETARRIMVSGVSIVKSSHQVMVLK